MDGTSFILQARVHIPLHTLLYLNHLYVQASMHISLHILPKSIVCVQSSMHISLHIQPKSIVCVQARIHISLHILPKSIIFTNTFHYIVYTNYMCTSNGTHSTNALPKSIIYVYKDAYFITYSTQINYMCKARIYISLLIPICQLYTSINIRMF